MHNQLNGTLPASLSNLTGLRELFVPAGFFFAVLFIGILLTTY